MMTPEPDHPVPLLGRLEQVNVRDVWAHEAHNFTPWLADSLDQLADAIGTGPLQLVGTEQRVGPFAIDILAETMNGDSVVIENQLATSDHTHLGQCLTYAAGVDARIVVWLVPRLLDEHRSALDWLNERTDERSQFFGVVVSVVKIADSLPAPVFTVEVRPNDWQKSARAAAAATPSAWRGWDVVYRALETIAAGEWTTVQDLAALGGTSPAWISRHMYAEQHQHPTIYRMLAKDRTPWQWLETADGNSRTPESVRSQLIAEGVTFDASGRAAAAQHVDTQRLESRLATPTEDGPTAQPPSLPGDGMIG